MRENLFVEETGKTKNSGCEHTYRSSPERLANIAILPGTWKRNCGARAWRLKNIRRRRRRPKRDNPPRVCGGPRVLRETRPRYHRHNGSDAHPSAPATHADRRPRERLANCTKWATCIFCNATPAPCTVLQIYLEWYAEVCRPLNKDLDAPDPPLLLPTPSPQSTDLYGHMCPYCHICRGGLPIAERLFGMQRLRGPGPVRVSDGQPQIPNVHVSTSCKLNQREGGQSI